MANKKERLKRFDCTASIAYSIKQWLEGLQTSDIKSARCVLTTITALDAVHFHIGAHKTRLDEITKLEDAQKANAKGEPLSDEQKALLETPRYDWWAKVYATMDADNPANGPVVVPEEAVDTAVKLLGALRLDATGTRLLLAFVDTVENATSYVAEVEKGEAKTEVKEAA